MDTCSLYYAGADHALSKWPDLQCDAFWWEAKGELREEVVSSIQKNQMQTHLFLGYRET
jgi:hypothetical protein